MAISFVAAGTAFSRSATGNGFTLNAPAGLATGDMMIAAVCFDSAGALRTVTPPAGWTNLVSARGSADSRDNQISIMYRVAGASEPGSWSGTLSSSSTYDCVAAVAAYRGVQQIGANYGTSAAASVTSFSTATVNNTTANSWRLVVGSYSSLTTNYTISSNETTRRVLFNVTGSDALEAAIWDSNAAVATGNTSRTVSRSASWSTASSVILLLEPSTGTPASGDLGGTLGKISADGVGEVHDDATVAATLPSVSALADGYGQPPVVTGTATAALPPLSASVSAATDAIGAMSVGVMPSLNIQAETRVFGVRVIVVEAEDRTIVVESRGVAD